MAEEKMFKAALEAVELGQTTRARDLFTRLLKSNSSRADYWLWMSTLVDSSKERIYCLESALRVDPDNEAARRGLLILGARQAGDDVKPAPLIKRNWETELGNVIEPQQSVFRRIWSSSINRLVFGVVLAVAVTGIILGFAIGNRSPKPAAVVTVYKVSPFPTRTSSPTLSPTITRTLAVRTRTPTPIGPTPLWMFLTQTYTPAPLYVNTPHPVIEAYRAGIDAYQASNWSNLLIFMEQAIAVEPKSPDLYYYQGEAYRKLGQPEEAVISYGDALEINSRFAPAYLGRALAYEAINPNADIEGELNYAINDDPYYVDAYLERARIRTLHGNPEGAIEDLLAAENLFPENPMVYVYRAQAYLKLGDPIVALEDAWHAFDLDLTSLPAHLTLAEVYLALNNSPLAISFVDVYLRYIQDSAEAWAVKSQAEYMSGNFDKSLDACTNGVTVDENNAQSWYYCGLIYLEKQDSGTAVNDLVNAVNLDPLNFDYSIALAKALWADDRLNMAARQYKSAENIATSDAQRAIIYYYRAQVYEQDTNMSDALADWTSLLALPEDQVPTAWRTHAQERWLFYNPPSATMTPTRTPVPTSTSTATNTATPTDTSTATYTPEPTYTMRPSPTKTPRD